MPGHFILPVALLQNSMKAYNTQLPISFRDGVIPFYYVDFAFQRCIILHSCLGKFNGRIYMKLSSPHAAMSKLL